MPEEFTPEALRKWRLENERILTKMSLSASADIRAVYNNFLARLDRRLRQISVSDDQLQMDAEKFKLIKDIGKLLDSALGKRGDGFKVVEEFRVLQKEAERRALAYFRKFGHPVTYSQTSRQVLNILFTEQQAGLLALYDERIRRPVIRAVRAQTLGVGTSEAFANAVTAAAGELSVAQIERAVEDGIRQVNRAASYTAARDNEQLDVAIWEGPEDGKTSEQCENMFADAPYGAPGVWLVSDLSADMVPGLMGNPQFEGGHPGCRHWFTYVDRQYAEEYEGAVFPDEN